MKNYYVMKPAKGTTTAYICRQDSYDKSLGRVPQTRVASFNVSTDPSAPAINITSKGQAAGYVLTPQHMAEATKWLRKNGTFGKVKVPANIIRQLRAEVEVRLRQELQGLSNSSCDGAVLAPKQTPAPPSLNDLLRAMLSGIDAVKMNLRPTKTGPNAVLSADAASAWRMCAFALSDVLELAEKHGFGRPKGWQTVAWADEAVLLGYMTADELEGLRKAAARAKEKASAKRMAEPLRATG